jgi:hypothetical protein
VDAHPGLADKHGPPISV